SSATAPATPRAQAPAAAESPWLRRPVAVSGATLAGPCLQRLAQPNVSFTPPRSPSLNLVVRFGRDPAVFLATWPSPVPWHHQDASAGWAKPAPHRISAPDSGRLLLPSCKRQSPWYARRSSRGHSGDRKRRPSISGRDRSSPYCVL